MNIWSGSLTVVCLAAAVPAAALTVHTSAFISNPSNFTSFENIGSITGVDGVNSYAEDGISVNYVGTGFIWSTSQSAPDGVYSWYPDGGGTGYTRITFAPASAIQFQASSGWFGEGASLYYEVLLNGNLLGTGSIAGLPAYGTGWLTYGFSGATFDEVRLQGHSNGAFDPVAFEAAAFDAIALGAVPEPASWAMMIAGFGLMGAALRRRRAAIA